jgi:hypothetical protein
MSPDQTTQFYSGLCICAACWLGGYGFALYRALGWVERMRRWAARSVEVHEEECDGC